eukprot:scaffold65099_cov67-Phaeocystis_antarctica.AAC.5
MKSSSIRPVTCRMDRIPTGETMTLTEIVALKGSKGGEGGGQGGIGGCVGGDGGDGGEGGEGGNCGGSSGCGGDGEGGSDGEGEGGRSSAPAADPAGKHPAAAARPRVRVTVRRRAVLHRDRTTGSIAETNVLATQIAGKLDASDRSNLWQHDARLVAVGAANPRVRVAIESIVEVVPAVEATGTPGSLSSPGVRAAAAAAWRAAAAAAKATVGWATAAEERARAARAM